MRKNKLLLIPLGLSLLAFIIYLSTAAPSMAWLDTLNFVDASVTLGVNGPPAPFYVFLAHFFTLLPFGSAIFRLQIFSALVASAALFLLYQIITWTGEQITRSNTPVQSNKKKQQLIDAEKINERTILFSGI
jgi:hypothetical protein